MTSAPISEAFQGELPGAGDDPEGSPPFVHRHGPASGNITMRHKQTCTEPAEIMGCFDQSYLDRREINVLAAEVARAAAGGAVACVCIPGVFQAMREAYPSMECALLDFNPWYKDTHKTAYAPYDYAHPTRIPSELQHHFAAIIAATPYPTAECALSIITTMQLLGKSSGSGNAKFYFLTEAALPAAALEKAGLRAAKLRPLRKTGSCGLYTNCTLSHRLRLEALPGNTG